MPRTISHAGDHHRTSDRPPRRTASLALAVELRLTRFYADSANRLRPFDLGVSQLLDMLALEREQQQRELWALARAMFGTLSTVETLCRRLVRSPVSRHFFILDPHDAALLLTQAQRYEGRASRFYDRCAAAERYPQLQQLYQRIGHCGSSREEVLAEAVEGLGMRHLGQPLIA